MMVFGVESTQERRLCERPPVILFVDDEVLIRSAVAEYLRAAEMVVIEAASAEEAVAVIASETAIDLVFTDVNMPGDMNGLGLSHWLARHRPEIAVLITSGRPRPTALPARVNGFLAKPYRASEATKRIHELLERRGE